MNDDDLLYHYTSAQGLIGLLGQPHRSATMWLTQLQYLNDAAEFYHAYELAREEIRRLDDNKVCPSVRRVMAGLNGVPHDSTGWHDPIVGTVLHTFCSFSLSEEADLLSQWRGYTPEGGYSVGFKVGDLRELARKQGLELIPCLYDDAAKRSQIESDLIQIEDGLGRGEIDPLIATVPGIPDSERANSTARVRVQNSVNSQARYFKHASFAEEREWRLVGHSFGSDGRAMWRARESIIVPYFELQIGKDSKRELRAQEVIIGSGLDFYHAKHAIQWMNFNQLPLPSVRPSRSSLRR